MSCCFELLCPNGELVVCPWVIVCVQFVVHQNGPFGMSISCPEVGAERTLLNIVRSHVRNLHLTLLPDREELECSVPHADVPAWFVVC